MPGHTATEMDAIEMGEFLDTQQTGVLSLAKDGDGYAIPVSFVYDDGHQDVYLRLGFAPASQKRKYLDATEHVSFVVYDETDEGWKSVVIQGTTEELSSSTLDSSIHEAVNDIEIPFMSVHQRPVTETEFRIVRISVTTINGLVEG